MAQIKKKTLFDHLNAIYADQRLSYWDELEDSDKKTYSTFMINRFLSMNPDYIEMVNLLQKYYGAIGPRESYLFYTQSGMIPRKRQFNKYIGKNTNGKHPDWAIELIAKHFLVSKSEAESYLDLYRSSKQGKEKLAEICRMYGLDSKKIGGVTK